MAYTSSFFTSLSRELRDQIYEYLWEDTPVLDLKYKDTWMQLCFKCLRPEEEHHALGLPCWLLTCQATLCEGLDELKRMSIWTIGPFHEPEEDLSSADHPQEWMFKGNTELLNPATTEKMTIWMNTLAVWDRSELRPWQMPEVRRLIKDTDAVNMIRTLRIKTAIKPGFDTTFDLEKANLHMQAFNNIQFRLRKFEVEFTCVDMYWTGRALSVEGWRRIQTQCGNEVGRLGRMYVGEKGVLSVHTCEASTTMLFTFSKADV